MKAGAAAGADMETDKRYGGTAEHEIDKSSLGDGAPGRASRNNAEANGGGGWGAEDPTPSSAIGDASDNTKRTGVRDVGGARAGKRSDAAKHPAGDAPQDRGAGVRDGVGDWVAVGDGEVVALEVVEAVADVVAREVEDATDETEGSWDAAGESEEPWVSEGAGLGERDATAVALTEDGDVEEGSADAERDGCADGLITQLMARTLLLYVSATYKTPADDTEMLYAPLKLALLVAPSAAPMPHDPTHPTSVVTTPAVMARSL